MTIASLSIVGQHRTGAETKVMQIFLSAPKSVRQFLDMRCLESGRRIRWPDNVPVAASIDGGQDTHGVDLYLLLSWMEESFGPMFQVATEKNGNVIYLFRSAAPVHTIPCM
ncbi:expressed unknown protein [Seminavis robusta]|uniref:Uncharacterized protein n=1 Tax=Seminavis robusta TaxID=568900 RepID=A0A9N8DQP4_9STRA|nr:expressed unknown protein [Seminavis robusta]|eukprot:Sro303_g112380.1 n/a (111) ;mRNA; f:22877-23209